LEINPPKENTILDKMKLQLAFSSLAFIALVSGCGQGQLADIVAAEKTPDIGTVADRGNEVFFEFPVPEFAVAINQTISTVDFESNLSLDKLVDFYRFEFSELGLTETSSQVVQGWGGRLFFEDTSRGLNIWLSITPSNVMFVPIQSESFVYLRLEDKPGATGILLGMELDYPLPDDAEIIDGPLDLLQIATDLSLNELAVFYRREFGALGLVEMKDTLDDDFRGLILFGDPSRGIEINLSLRLANTSSTLSTSKASIVSFLSPGPAPTPGPSFLTLHSEYPLTLDAVILDDNIDFINFETDFTIEELIEFYRIEMAKLNLVESKFDFDEKTMTGTLFFDESGGITIVMIVFAPEEEAPPRFKSFMKKSTFVVLGYYPALIDPCKAFSNPCDQ